MGTFNMWNRSVTAISFDICLIYLPEVLLCARHSQCGRVWHPHQGSIWGSFFLSFFFLIIKMIEGRVLLIWWVRARVAKPSVIRGTVACNQEFGFANTQGEKMEFGFISTQGEKMEWDNWCPWEGQRDRRGQLLLGSSSAAPRWDSRLLDLPGFPAKPEM